MNSRNDELLENDNRQRTERLQQKVSQLKNFAVDIETETKEHNRLLDDAQSDFHNILGSLIGGTSRINRLILSKRNNRTFIFYLTIAITLLILFIFYFWIVK